MATAMGAALEREGALMRHPRSYMKIRRFVSITTWLPVDDRFVTMNGARRLALPELSCQVVFFDQSVEDVRQEFRFLSFLHWF